MANEFLELGKLSDAVADRKSKVKRGENGAVNEILRTSTDDAEAYFITVNDAFLRKEECVDVVVEAGIRIKRLLRKHGITKQKLVLVAGVGNGGMTADSLGVRTLNVVKATEQLRPFRGSERRLGRMATVAPGVEGVTGVKSYGVIGSVKDAVGADAVIAVDTLACRQISRLGRTIQITDGGIVPGSGVGNSVKALTLENLGVPVIAIGVPLVIYARNIVAEFSAKSAEAYRELGELVVTVKDIDGIAEVYARIIGKAINYAVHGNAF